MISPKNLFDRGSEPVERDRLRASWVVEILILVVAVLSLFSSVVSQPTAALWFRIVVAVFSVAVILWVGNQFRPGVVALWQNAKAKRRLKGAVRKLHPTFRNLVEQFQRYTEQTRSDNIPPLLNTISQREGFDLPLGDTSSYHVWRFYETLAQRVPHAPVSPRQFRGLIQDFGNILEIYHRLYVLRPTDKLRMMASLSSQSPIYHYVPEFEVYREGYNAFLRGVTDFGAVVNSAFQENVFPTHLEPVKPLV